MQAGSYAAEQTRRAVFADFNTGGGVIGTGTAAVSAGAGMTVNVSTGVVLVPGSSSTTQGMYYVDITATDNDAVTASNPSNPRIDLVCMTVDDAAYTGIANDAKIQVIAGTPSAGATLVNLVGAPSLPASSLFLRYVLVPAGAASIVAGDIGTTGPALASSGVPYIGQIDNQLYAVTGGVFTTPNDGITHTWRFTIVGGGGGGGAGAGGSADGNKNGGGGGAGGAAGAMLVVPVAIAPNTQCTVTLGAGGAGGTGSNSPSATAPQGTDGTLSSIAVTGGSTYKANGGQGGQGGTGGRAGNGGQTSIPGGAGLSLTQVDVPTGTGNPMTWGPGAGGSGGFGNANGPFGNASPVAAYGSTGAATGGGGGGAGGVNTTGGTGGTGGSNTAAIAPAGVNSGAGTSTGTAGTAGAAGTGAGGGGGGGAGGAAGSTNGGSGGAGGIGFVLIELVA